MQSDKKADQNVLCQAHVELFLRIYLLGRRIKSLVKDQNQDQMSEVLVLALVRNRPVSVGRLALMIGIKPSAMSDKVTLLLKRGLVQRVESADARRKLIKITDKGLVRFDEVKKELRQQCVVNKLELGLEEVKETLATLNKIYL